MDKEGLEESVGGQREEILDKINRRHWPGPDPGL